MKKKILLFVFLCIFHTGFSQQYTISGFIEDEGSGERLIGATISDVENPSKGTITNVYGFYSITLSKPKITLKASFVGYTPKLIQLDLKKDTSLNIYLSSGLELEEITVNASLRQVDDVQMSSVEIPIQTVHKLPVLLGEIDVLKTIQLLPGVQSGTEGSSGIYVRGGGPDQNLILLDGVPVYNVNHLFGFFSVFNGYAINDVSLIKGGFPARYGGRLSSVLDIRMKEGNMKKMSGQVSIGLIASKFTLEGPIQKDKTSFIISGRRTYLDVLAAPFMLAYSQASYGESIWGGYFFHDLNAKINHKFNDKDRLYFSIYTGKDKAYMNTKYKSDDYSDKLKFNLHWGNITSALRWNHVFSPKLFSNSTLTYSRYNFITDINNEYEYQSWDNPDDNKVYRDEIRLEYLSGIEDFSGKIDFDYLPNPNHKIKFGSNITFHTFRPGVSAFRYKDGMYEQSIDTTYGSGNLYAQEITAYAEDEIKIGKRLKINAGLHYSMFNVRDTLYQSLQPRFSARLLLTDTWSLKAAYSQMQQYLHFLTNSTIGLPTDLWLPATDKIHPQRSDQYAIGTAISLSQEIDLSIEAFYKEMDNLIEYKEGASFFEDPEANGLTSQGWEQKIEQGKGWSYGGEVFLQKKYGKFTGWVGYTLSWTNRKFQNIAFGEVFPYRYDRRHDISIALTYKFNDRVDIGATWVYGTGIAVTLAQQKYMPVEFIETKIWNDKYPDNYYYIEATEHYGKRNNYRLPDYHRLDIGVNLHKEKKRGIRTWSFGLYNAYNRLNAFYVDFSGGMGYGFYGEQGIKPKLMKYSLFPIIPSFSYNFKFK